MVESVLASLTPEELNRDRQKAIRKRISHQAEALHRALKDSAAYITTSTFISFSEPLYDENLQILCKRGFRVYSVALCFHDGDANDVQQHLLISWDATANIERDILPNFSFSFKGPKVAVPIERKNAPATGSNANHVYYEVKAWKEMISP